MPHTIRAERQSPSRTYANTGGATIEGINVYAGPWETTAATKVLEMAFTPTDVSVTVNPAGDDSVTMTNGTMRTQVCVGGHTMAGAYYFRAGARRKPGTTGAIVAQAITFTINSVQVGKFTVAAADASTDPICGSVEMVSPTLDTRFNFGTPWDLIVAVTAADSDLEIFFTIVGA